MTKKTEQQELDHLEKQLNQLGELKRDRAQADATYQAITGKPLSRWGRLGIFRPVAIAAVLLLLATPFALNQNQVGGLFGHKKPTPTPTVAPATPAAKAEPKTENAPAAQASPVNQNASVQSGSSGQQVVPSVPSVQKPKVPIREKIQNRINSVLGGLGL